MVEDRWERSDDEVESLWLDCCTPARVGYFAPARNRLGAVFEDALAGANKPALPSQGESGTGLAGSSALLSAKRMSCVPALLSPAGGSRRLVVAVPEGRPNTERALSGRPRADQAVAKCFSFLAGLELGEDPPCLTVDDDECLQGAEPWGDPRHDGCAVCPMLTKGVRPKVGSRPSRERVAAPPKRDRTHVDTSTERTMLAAAGALRSPVVSDAGLGRLRRPQ